jgi:ribosomal protein S6
MPCYQLLCFAKADMTPDRLASLFRAVARVVYREGGNFRTVENLGVRPLAYPLRKSGARYEEVRWVSATFDAAPPVLAAVGSIVDAEKDVLQYHHQALEGRLAAFKAVPPEGRRRRLSASLKWGASQFDPHTLRLKPRTASAGEQELR